ncbi:type II toxin-antitoxin system TacA family antitoxin [Achromobacter kerstersii]|uniref:type II toxin-antitoxin system TacA family antitoxin n=1 Tax=Achromobacter kerstersii TaxID=1353890 RepID=UPI0015836006|nr:DUF1778 domain-containing protein [Achromobacter kerstersii]
MRESDQFRIEITPALHALLERAATLKGNTLEEFVAQTLTRVAEAAMPKNDLIFLSKAGQEALVESLLDPPPPNAALKKASQQHKKLFGY